MQIQNAFTKYGIEVMSFVRREGTSAITKKIALKVHVGGASPLPEPD